MIQDLQTLLSFSESALWTGFAVLMRVGSMMAVLPVFGEQTIPVRVRLGLALAFTLVVTPALASSIAPQPDTLLATLAYLGPEVLTGLFFGLLLRFFVFVLQIAGTIAAQSTSLSQIFGGTAGADPQPAMSHVLLTAGLALAALMGLHVEIARYILATYAILPIGVLISPEVVADFGVSAVAYCFQLGFVLAAPFLIASLVYNVTLGVINRAMPQLMVSFVGAPAITAGGLFLLFLTAPLMLSIWIEAFSAFIMNPAEGLK